MLTINEDELTRKWVIEREPVIKKKKMRVLESIWSLHMLIIREVDKEKYQMAERNYGCISSLG